MTYSIGPLHHDCQVKLPTGEFSLAHHHFVAGNAFLSCLLGHQHVTNHLRGHITCLLRPVYIWPHFSKSTKVTISYSLDKSGGNLNANPSQIIMNLPHLHSNCLYSSLFGCMMSHCNMRTTAVALECKSRKSVAFGSSLVFIIIIQCTARVHAKTYAVCSQQHHIITLWTSTVCWVSQSIRYYSIFYENSWRFLKMLTV